MHSSEYATSLYELYELYRPASRLTGQFADKPTRGQSSPRTGQLADSKFLLNHGQIIIYLYNKQKRNTKPNPIDY